MNLTEFAALNIGSAAAPMTYSPTLTDEEKSKLIKFLEARAEYVVEAYGTSNTVAGRWLGIGRLVEVTDLILILKGETPR